MMGTQAGIKKPLDGLTDDDILNDVICICREGENLYKHAANNVEEQQWRNMYAEMAVVRSKIASELEIEINLQGGRVESARSQLGINTQWYINVRNSYSDYQDGQFLEQLEKTENKSVQVLRTAVSQVQDQALAYRLASLVAAFQIAHDKMKALIYKHK